MKLGLLALGALLAIQLPVFANEKGNGGDSCEDHFQSLAQDIHSWIDGGGPAGLSFPDGISLTQYVWKMDGNIAAAKVSCIDAPVVVGGAEKTCKNYFEGGAPIIVCNNKRFLEANEIDKYILVHHEFAGLSGFERNDGATSRYFISNQISGYLKATSDGLKLVVAHPGNLPGGYASGEIALLKSETGSFEAVTVLGSPDGSNVLLIELKNGSVRTVTPGALTKIVRGTLGGFASGETALILNTLSSTQGYEFWDSVTILGLCAGGNSLYVEWNDKSVGCYAPGVIFKIKLETLEGFCPGDKVMSLRGSNDSGSGDVIQGKVLGATIDGRFLYCDFSGVIETYSPSQLKKVASAHLF